MADHAYQQCIDPNCAAGILKAMHEKYGDHWPLRATFFVLLNADEPGLPLFRQDGLGPQKVRTLVEWGMEIGSHTINHLNLSQATPAEIKWDLAVSQNRLEALIPGHQVRSFAVPFGAYPADIAPEPAGDGLVNMLDFAMFASCWLEGVE